MILNRINFHYNEPLVQQVKFLVGVKQIIIFAALVVWLKHVEKAVYVEVFLTDFLFFQHLAVFRSDKLIESIEAWNYVAFLFQFTDVERHGIRQGDLFRSCGRLVVLLPKRQEQCLDALSLLDVKDLILGEERIE